MCARVLLSRDLSGREPLEETNMQSVTFSPEEIEVLREVLRAKIDELDVETFRTDSHDFKLKLKHRRDVLEHLMAKFSAIPVAV